MHQPPPVSYPVVRGGAWIAAVVGASVAVPVYACLRYPLSPWRQALVLAVMLASGVAALLTWWRAPRGVMQWDGSGWFWQHPPSDTPGRLEVCLDWQHLMLLRWRSDEGPPTWFWVSRASAPAQWDDWRRAVYTRQAGS